MELQQQICEYSEIKPIEIDNILINSQVLTPFCVSWSRDDKISILVEGGVYILELWPIPQSESQSITFLKSWIPASTSVPLSKAIGEENSNFLWNLTRREAYECTLNSTLSYGIQKSNSAFGASQIISCEFSPLVKNESYISCLTNNGLLTIYKNNFKKWSPIVDLTENWISYFKERNDFKELDFNKFKLKMFELKIIVMKWCNKPKLLFLTGHENGTICIWNVDVLSDGLNLKVRYCINTTDKPCSIEFSELSDSNYILLFIGVVSGVVKCFLINLSTGEIKQNFKLWEHDDFILPKIIKTKYFRDKLLVFIVKRHVLLIQWLSVNESNFIKKLKIVWKEFPSIISSFNEFQNDFIICLQNHDGYVLEIKEKFEYSVKILTLGVRAKHKTSYHCFGLAMSQNYAIWILVSSPKVNYDSLKEITHLSLYSTELKMFKSLMDLTSSGLIEKIVVEFKETKLNEIFDLLELKKMELLTDSSKFKDCYEMNMDPSILDVKLTLWEVKLKLFCNSAETDSTVANLECLIAKKRAKEIVAKFQNCDQLSEMERKSFNISQILLADDAENSRFPCGICMVCGLETYFENARMSSCSNSHTFPRCCLSLLPCDTISYATCKNCDSVALEDFGMKQHRVKSRQNQLTTDFQKTKGTSNNLKICGNDTYNKFRLKRNKANARERNRMHGLNVALDRLRSHLPIKTSRPGLSTHHKFSKIETLKMACNYIRILTYMLKRNGSIELSSFVNSLAVGLSNPTASVIATSLGHCHFFTHWRQPLNLDSFYFDFQREIKTFLHTVPYSCTPYR